MWHSYPYSPGSKLVSAPLPQPIPRVAGATACLHIPWMSTAALPCLGLLGQCRADWCPCIRHLQMRLFLKSGSNLCWKGAPCFNLAKTSYFMHVLLLLQQSPSFSCDLKLPQICIDYPCRFPEGTPCCKAPCASRLLSSHCGLPVSHLGQGQLPGCHQAVPWGAAVSVRKLWFSTAMWPWPRVVATPSCGCCTQTPLPQRGHLTSVLWAATAEAAGSAHPVINREKWALSGAMCLTPIRHLLLHRVNYILRAPIDYRSSPG